MFSDGQVLFWPLYIGNLVSAGVLAMEGDSEMAEAHLIAKVHYTFRKGLGRRSAREMGAEVQFRVSCLADGCGLPRRRIRVPVIRHRATHVSSVRNLAQLNKRIQD